MTGRPRTAIGTYGDITTRRRGGRVVAEARIRDTDGRLHQVRVTGRTAAQARSGSSSDCSTDRITAVQGY